MSLLRNPKPAVYAILLFIAALLLLFSIHARASDLTFEAGAAVVRGEAEAIGINIQWPGAGPVGTDYEAGFSLVGSSRHNRDNPNAIVVHGMLTDGWKRAELGLGFYAHNVEWEYNCGFGFTLLARYRFTPRISAQWRHYSSAGTCSPNPGRDLLTVGWRF